MAYILDADLTDEYIQTLITRANFTDITASYYGPEYAGIFYVIQDLNGQILEFGANRPGVRDYCITQWLIQQNS